MAARAGPGGPDRALSIRSNPAVTRDGRSGGGGPRDGLKVLAIRARTESDFEPAFAQAVQQGTEALLVSADRTVNSRLRPARGAGGALHAARRLPRGREYAEVGGLMSYGDQPGWRLPPGRPVCRPRPQGRQAGRPAVQNPNKFELLINLKTAKALGLTVPRIVLAGADEAID